MCPGWRCVHVARGQGSAGIRVRGLGSLWRIHGGVGCRCCWLWVALGKVLNLGHHKVSPSKERKAMPWECRLLFLQEMWEPLPDPAV